tara:strand:- start:86 stop:1024 length:939 start_codon:yes stop_codon:yes gene_type:complete
LKQPLISVIIPVYNRAHSISKSIQSILNQTYQNFEIIVVDDGSTDDILTALKAFDNIKYIKLPNNQGQANARKVGCNQSKGDFICSLDSDDTWKDMFLEESLRYMIKYNLDLFFSNWCRSQKSTAGNLYRFSNLSIFKNEIEEDLFVIKNSKIREHILSHCIFPSSSMMIKKSSMSVLWDENIKVCDDWELTINLILTNSIKKTGGTLKVLWEKHISDDNICDNRSDIAFIERIIQDRMYMQQKFTPFMTNKEKKTFKTSIVESRLRKLLIGIQKGSLKTILEVFSKKYLNPYLLKAIINGSRRVLKRKKYA